MGDTAREAPKRAPDTPALRLALRCVDVNQEARPDRHWRGAGWLAFTGENVAEEDAERETLTDAEVDREGADDDVQDGDTDKEAGALGTVAEGEDEARAEAEVDLDIVIIIDDDGDTIGESEALPLAVLVPNETDIAGEGHGVDEGSWVEFIHTVRIAVPSATKRMRASCEVTILIGGLPKKAFEPTPSIIPATPYNGWFTFPASPITVCGEVYR